MRKTKVVRTVKNGKVKIYGVYYSPTERWKKYDGRFENTKLEFYIYGDGVDFIYMYDCPLNNDGSCDWDFWDSLSS